MALFRYLTFEGGLATLKHGTLKLTPPREFNDPFDMFFGVKSEPTQLGDSDVVAASPFDSLDDRRLVQYNISNLVNNQYGAVSFGRVHDSIPMWAYYCGNQSGVVIEFDEHDTEFHNYFKNWLHDVGYVFSRPVISKEAHTDISDLSPYNLKSLQWAHEAEARIIYPLTFAEVTPATLNGRPAWLLKYPRTAVKAIYFGCRMEATNKHLIASELANWGFSDVRLVEMGLHLEHFAFEERRYKAPANPPEPDPEIPPYSIQLCWCPEEELYFARVPEIPECKARGATAEEVLENMKKAICEVIRVAQKKGDSLPEPELCKALANAVPSF